MSIMKKRYYLDSTLIKGVPIVFEVLFLLMAGFSLLAEVSIRPLILLLIANAFLIPLWVGFAWGTYAEISNNKLRMSRMFFRGKEVSLEDIVSIHARSIYGGLFAEVYAKVRKPDGTSYEQGLINKPGLSQSQYKQLFSDIRSVNPNVQIEKI